RPPAKQRVVAEPATRTRPAAGPLHDSDRLRPGPDRLSSELRDPASRHQAGRLGRRTPGDRADDAWLEMNTKGAATPIELGENISRPLEGHCIPIPKHRDRQRIGDQRLHALDVVEFLKLAPTDGEDAIARAKPHPVCD